MSSLSSEHTEDDLNRCDHRRFLRRRHGHRTHHFVSTGAIRTMAAIQPIQMLIRIVILLILVHVSTQQPSSRPSNSKTINHPYNNKSSAPAGTLMPSYLSSSNNGNSGSDSIVVDLVDIFSTSLDSSRNNNDKDSGSIDNGNGVAGVICTMDDLERANDMQLHVIFQELTSLEFFQHFLVDLDHKCPLSSSSKPFSDDDDGRGHRKTSDTSAATHEEQTDEVDEFHCDGGADELDEDAEPLCSVEIGGSDDENGLFGGMGGGGSTSANPLIDSNVLQSLSQTGFSSNTQRDAFKWNDQTDMVVQEEDSACDESAENGPSFNLPDSFWMDMCSKIHEGDGTKIVNLALNPERNTGYNGTHIWRAIYEENCIIDDIDRAGNVAMEHSFDSAGIEDSMCLEERVLYRLLSGMHTSTTLSIAQNYYPPSKRKNRTDWEANPHYFMEKFQDHPEYIRNLHFSYVVLLRAIKKASSYLYNYEFHSGNVVDDKASSILMKRLLDTSILRSCSNVFSAFDESVMFSQEDAQNNRLLQQSFKGVFHNISSILDCVQCQQCKLHGKLHMLGYGTALKILFVQDIETNLRLEQNEVVALLNTAARLSESLMQVRELTMMYWEHEQKKIADLEVATEAPPGSLAVGSSGLSWDSLDALDVTVSVIASLGRQGLIGIERERELIDLALSRHPDLLILGKHYHTDLDRFLILAQNIGNVTTGQEVDIPAKIPDAIVVGTGLAGLAAALNILDRDGSVVLVEKEHLLGGNSNKASSGINGCCPLNDTYNDSLESFRNDTIKSAGAVADLNLINVLVSKSEEAILWLKDRANVDLSLLAQLGGHSNKRTHRPSNGMAGAEIIYNLQKAVRKYEDTGRLKILVDTRVKKLITDEKDSDRVVGVHCESTKDGIVLDLFADNVILATGGFASDRSKGSYLDQYRPELMTFPATAGPFSTGDGVSLATDLGAATRDMDKVQIHPTGWVDPSDPGNPTKILAAELMRGVGGILINDSGKRFCNELGTRAYVTDQMLKHDKGFATTGRWDASSPVPTFHLVLSSSAAADAKKHIDLYSHKGLLTKVEGISALSKQMGINKSQLSRTIRAYQLSAANGKDEFGKTSFRGVPKSELEDEVFYVGTVTPVLHYCMGGIKIDTEGNVMREDGTTIKGLHAAGEVTGGVHGNNRLGGNSLLECTVFGTIVGKKVPVKEGPYRMQVSPSDKSSSSSTISTMTSTSTKSGSSKHNNELPTISPDELSKHNTEDDLWVAIHGVVYDFTDFAHEHPAGFESIFDLAGSDGTSAFDAVHNLGMLDDFEDDKRGLYII